MASEDTQTATSSSGPSNRDVIATTSKLAKGIGTAYDTGPQVFNQSTFAGAGGTTQDAWQKALTAAGNPDFTSSIGGAIKSFGDTAAGKNIGTDNPAYAQVRQKAMDDAVTNVGAGFIPSGRFGGGSYVDAATTAAGNVAAGMDLSRLSQDEQNQKDAAQLLPGLFNSAQLPASTAGAVGAAQDANSQGQLSGQYDLATRKANSWTDLLAKLTSAAGGNAATSGTTTSSTSPQTPWWQSLGGMALQAL